MKILQINKFLYPRGGAETYLFALSALLAQNGHEVFFFSQENQKNIFCGQEKYFIDDLELGRFSLRSLFKIGRIFWSYSASRKIKKLIQDLKPDLIHIHNIYHQISPSILPAIKKAGLPIVMTVHDFKLIKPDYTLRACPTKSRAIFAGRGRAETAKPLVAKILMNLEFKYHQWLKIYQKNIDLFVAPSEFVKNKLMASGIKAEKIEVVPHFADSKKYDKTNNTAGEGILFFGRLDESKGADNLIRAFSHLAVEAHGRASLQIVGDGPQTANLKNLVKKLKIENRVEFLGRKTKDELRKIIQDSRLAVFPSRVHETFGLGILEAYAQAKPVIAARVGAYPEIVKENETGLLVSVDNIDELKNAMVDLINNPEKAKVMGENGRKLVESEYNPEKHYEAIMKIYTNLNKKL